MRIAAIRNCLSLIKLKIQGGYNAKKYWKARHQKFGFDRRGVGNKNLSDKKNREQYEQALSVYIEICNENLIEFENISVLDVGCGSGFYTKLFVEQGCRNYLGIDIVDVLFNDLRNKYPSCTFKIIDITKDLIEGMYDLISMIDVTQHITNEKKFAFAMQNIRSHLNSNGLFIVTSWLAKKNINSFYEKSRSLEDYKRFFHIDRFSEPRRFRDKYIFSIRKEPN